MPDHNYDMFCEASDNTRYAECLSTFTSLFFLGTALAITLRGIHYCQVYGVRVLLVLMLVNLSITGFFVHSRGSREPYALPEPGHDPVWVYLDRSAQAWLLSQLTLWSIFGMQRYPWKLSLFPAGIAYTYTFYLAAGSSEAIVFFLGQFGILFLALFHQEWQGRKRFGQWAGLLCGTFFLGTLYIYEADFTIWMGQFGHTWIHFMQSGLIFWFYFFWIQQDQQEFWCRFCGNDAAANSQVDASLPLFHVAAAPGMD